MNHSPTVSTTKARFERETVQAKFRLAKAFASGGVLAQHPESALSVLVKTNVEDHFRTANQTQAAAGLLEAADEALSVSLELFDGLMPALDAACRALFEQAGVLPPALRPWTGPGTAVTAQPYVPLAPAPAAAAAATVDQLKVQAAKAKLRLLALKK